MTAPVVTAPPSATLEELAQRMLERRVGSVVIVDPSEADVPAGIVTETDFEVSDDPIPLTFFRWPRLFGRYVWSERSLEDLYARARGRSAAEVMSSPVETVGEDDLLWDAVDAMVRKDVKRLPVVRDGRLVGILSRRDLLKCLVSEPAGPAE
jgi:CBS domain-containing protein